MAFFRFSRDKRGYEHFYLVEPLTNRKGKSRPRVLYWYRTPPNVKVGRPPFDNEMRRAIEAQYPDVTFDWTKIVEAPIPSADAEKWRERRRAERAARRSNLAVDADEDGESTEEPDHAAAMGEEPIDAESPPTTAADAGLSLGPVDGVWDMPGEGQAPSSADAGDAAESAALAPDAAGESPTQQSADSPRVGRKRRRRRRGRGHPAPGVSGTAGSVAVAESPIDTAGSVADDASSDDPIDEPSGE